MRTACSNPDAAALRIASRYIPPNSVTVEHRLAVCYTQDGTRGNGSQYFSVMCYIGAAGKAAFYESYRTAEQRDKRVADTFAGLERSEVARRERKSERSRPHTVKVGDIIHHSWGYEQTQCDYYQVLAVTAHGATIQAIAGEPVPGSEGRDCCRMVAVKDKFCGEPFRVRIDGYGHVGLPHGSARVWDGTAKYCSWYA